MSLSYLRRLPVDIVKIDRSFVTDLARGGAATTLVASILELARSLSLDVFAEGVETPVQQAALTELGCSFAQGYLFGRPGRWTRAAGPPARLSRLRAGPTFGDVVLLPRRQDPAGVRRGRPPWTVRRAPARPRAARGQRQPDQAAVP